MLYHVYAGVQMFEPTSSPAEPIRPKVPTAHTEPSVPADAPAKGSRHKLCETNACLLRAIPFEKVVEGVSDAPKKKCRGVVWE